MAETISPNQLGKFVKHLCLVSKKYYDKEQAQFKVEQHLSSIKEIPGMDKEIVELNKHINNLLETETRIAELGLSKGVPKKVYDKMILLERQLKLTQEERDKLTQKNSELQKAMKSITDLQRNIELATSSKDKTEERMIAIESTVNKRYKEYMLQELHQKIVFLESGLKKLSRDKTISPAKIIKLKDKIRIYKKQLIKQGR